MVTTKYIDLNAAGNLSFATRLVLASVDADGDDKVTEKEFGALDTDKDTFFSSEDVRNNIKDLLSKRSEYDRVIHQYCSTTYVSCKATADSLFRGGNEFETVKRELRTLPFYSATFPKTLKPKVPETIWVGIKKKPSAQKTEAEKAFDTFFSDFKGMLDEYKGSKQISDDTKKRLLESASDHYSDLHYSLQLLFEHLKDPAKNEKAITATLELIEVEFKWIGLDVKLTFPSGHIGMRPDGEAGIYGTERSVNPREAPRHP